MAVVRNTLLVVGLLAAPTAFVTPPLYAPVSAESLRVQEERNHSPLGLAGKRLYETSCAACHGAKGRGGADGPSLLAPSAAAQLSGAVFHTAAAGEAKVQRASRRSSGTSFNELELIARYLREVRDPPRFRQR